MGDFPGIFMSANFIIGFPSESEHDFKKTLEFISKKYFDAVGFHKYYDTPSIESYNYAPKVSQDIIEKRCKEANAALEAQSIEGESTQILVENGTR